MNQADESAKAHLGADTHAGMAEMVALRVLVGRFAWSMADGWMGWDGRRWKRCAERQVTDAVRSEFLAAFRKSNGAESWRKWLSASNIRAVTNLAGGHPDIVVEPSDFDAHPDLLNVANGIVDLRTGEIRDHDPSLLLTKLAPIDYVPYEEHPDWKAALEALPADVRHWYQLRIGQAATGHMTPDDVMIVQVGSGENGKTTIAAALRAALGDYFVDVSHRALLGNPGDHPTELMAFRGARLALVEETPEARRLSTVRLKQTVGTPTMTARHIRQDSVTWWSTHSLFLSTNYRPEVEETDHGTWRRLALLTFPFTFRSTSQTVDEAAGERLGDPDLRQRLQDNEDGQLEAVLSWIVDGAQRWYGREKEMGQHPDRVVADTRAWRAESDLVVAYIDDRLIFDPQSHIASADLLADFNSWLVDRGHRPWSDKTLSARFGSHGDVAGQVAAQRVRSTQPGLSRPQQRWSVPVSPLPERFRSWAGVRFASHSSQIAPTGTGGTAESGERPIDPHEGLSELPVPPVPEGPFADEARA